MEQKSKKKSTLLKMPLGLKIFQCIVSNVLSIILSNFYAPAMKCGGANSFDLVRWYVIPSLTLCSFLASATPSTVFDAGI